MNHNRLILLLIIYLNFISISFQLDLNEIDAITLINSELYQGFDLGDICGSNLNKIECDLSSEHVTSLTLVNPIDGLEYQIGNHLKDLELLVEFKISTIKITPTNDFWNTLQQLSQLDRLHIQQIFYSLPFNFGSTFPYSLTWVSIDQINQSLPEVFFTDSNIKRLEVGLQNAGNDSIFPPSISSTSKLERLSLRSAGSFKMDGSNFNNLSNLYINFGDTINYNKFNTFPALSNVFIQITNPSAAVSEFPSSLLNIPSLLVINIDALNNQINPPPSGIIDFSGCININSVVLSGWTLTSSYNSPIVKIGGPISYTSLTIKKSTVDLAKLGIFQFNSVDIQSSSYVNNLPIGNYSLLNDLLIGGYYQGTIPDSVCSIKRGLVLIDSGVTSLPACFVCDWGNTNLFSSVFNNNTLLPAYTQSCPSFQYNNQANKISTYGGYLPVKGDNIGWDLYTSGSVKLETTVIEGNKLINFKVPAGTGINRSIPIYFHYIANPTFPFISYVYSYLPPTISNVFVKPLDSVISISGSSFGSQSLNPVPVINVVVAGITANVTYFTHDIIVVENIGKSLIPYHNEVVVSVYVEVDGQSSRKLIKPSGYNVQFSSTLPILNVNGGIVEFQGQFLSFDQSIMNLTINGVVVMDNDIIESVPTKLTVRYDAMPVGSYPLVYQQDTYKFNGVIRVSDGSLCKGTPLPCNGNGDCDAGKCKCIDEWKGEICDSIITPIPPPSSVDESNPVINTGKDEVNLHISIVSIKELDHQGNEQVNQELSQWEFTQTSTNGKQTYNYQKALFENTKINVTVDYFKEDTLVEFAGETTLKLAGSIKYSANITNWPFKSTLNQLQLIFSSAINDNKESSGSCSYKSIQYQDDGDNVESVNIQINNKTFSTSFTNLAVIDGNVHSVKNLLIPSTNSDTHTESNAMIAIQAPYHKEYIVIDPDFNLLISYVPPSEKEGSICSNDSSKGLTKSQIAGIVVGCVVFGIVGVIILVLILKRSMRVKLAMLAFKSKFDKI